MNTILLLCIVAFSAGAYAKHHHHHNDVNEYTDSVFNLLDIKTASDAEQAEEATEYCRNATNADVKLIDKGNNGHFTDDKNVHCYYACLSVKFGTMNPEGEWNLNRICEVTTDLTDDYIKSCIKNNPSPDPCEKAYNVFKCFKKQTMKDEEEKKKNHKKH